MAGSVDTNHHLRKLLNDAQLAWATPHTLRRSRITDLEAQGAPLALLADLAGHSDASMTARKYLGRRRPTKQLREMMG